jgi:hypothetical protein
MYICKHSIYLMCSGRPVRHDPWLKNKALSLLPRKIALSSARCIFPYIHPPIKASTLIKFSAQHNFLQTIGHQEAVCVDPFEIVECLQPLQNYCRVMQPY